MPKPVAPRDDAPKAEHKKHAKEVLEYEEYKKEPPGGLAKNDDVTPFKNNDKEP